MTGTFVEYQDISLTEPLRRGDVLEAIDPDASLWNRNLLVITADCDLAHAKNLGRVTAVPVLTQHEYLTEIQIPKLRERAVSRLIGLIQSLPRDQGAPLVSNARLQEWVDEQDPTIIASILKVATSSAEVAIEALQAVHDLQAASPVSRISVETLVSAKMVGNNGKRASARKEVSNTLTSCYANTPGDALFISSISAGHDAGYFAYLRHIEQIWEPEISIGPTRAHAKYRRISRIRDNFTRALVQRFALVFMSIGLPAEYEDVRSLYSDYLGESIK